MHVGRLDIDGLEDRPAMATVLAQRDPARLGDALPDLLDRNHVGRNEKLLELGLGAEAAELDTRIAFGGQCHAFFGDLPKSDRRRANQDPGEEISTSHLDHAPLTEHYEQMPDLVPSKRFRRAASSCPYGKRNTKGETHD